MGALFLAMELPLLADDTLVATGAACRYQVPTSDADGKNWTTVAFDDSSWELGTSGIGYENGSGYASLFGATVPSKTVTFCARFAFNIAALTNYDSLILSMKYDDGFVAYLNGVEVARANAPETLLYSSTATALHADTEAVVFQDYDISAYLPLLQTGTNVLAVHALNDSSSSSDFLMLPELTATQPSLFTNVVINEFMAVNDSTVKNSLGKYGDWVELYNPFSTNVNLAGWYLTDNASKLTKWQFPSGSASTISAKSYLLVWTDDKSYSLTNSELHTSFSLKGEGEYLGLVRPDGVTVVHQYAPTFPEQYGDISYGLGETGENRYFATPTPGAANAFDGGSNEVGGVKFSPKRGVYTNAMPQVAVTASTEGSVIRYTTDCEAPTEAGALYSSPFDLSHTTVFRAAAYKSGFAPSAVSIATYTNVPTFSAGQDQSINLTVTDSVNLYASVENPGGATNEVHYVWSCSSADGSVTFANATQSVATATFTQAGVYELVLTLSYGQLVTNRSIIVTVSTTNTLNQIPYKEGFESYALNSTLIGVHGWYGADAEFAVIATNRFASAPGGTPLSCAHTQSLGYSGSVTNEFAEMAGLTNICMDMLIGTQQGDDDQPVLDSDVQLGLRFNEARHLVVWHGVPGSTNQWTEITDVAAQSNAFVRLTVMADYARDVSGSFKFRVWVDRVAVTNPTVWFESACTNRNYLSRIVFQGEGQVDDLVVDDYNSMLYRRIVASSGAHGCVDPSGELYVPVGTSTNIAVLPDTFYGVRSVFVDGQNIGSTGNYTFTNVCDEHTLAADFAARLTASGVPELWLNGLNPAWVDNFEAHAREDSGGDGIDNGQEYEAGTDATNAQSVFMIDLRMDDGASVLSFPTVPFVDAFGLSRRRHYALEESEDLTADGWRDVEGWTDVVGDGQPVVYTNNFVGTIRFFRGRVWLEP